ncbi:MAG: glycosyltransferase, partial [Ferruginibacter sp.]
MAFITYEYPPDTGKGGIGTYTKQVADVLGRQGWDVHVFAGSHHRQCENYENNIHIHWVRCDSPHDFRLKVLPVFQSEHSGKAFELMESPEIHGNAWEIKKAFPQVPLIVRFHAANWLVERLKKKYSSFTSRLRFVLGALLRGRWDLGYWRKYDYRNDPDYQFCLLADAMAAPSEAMIKWVAHNWKLRVPGIKLIPNLFVAPGALLQLPVPEKAIYKKIVFFGRLNVLKGLVNATL